MDKTEAEDAKKKQNGHQNLDKTAPEKDKKKDNRKEHKKTKTIE